jgi:hypothetical protein
VKHELERIAIPEEHEARARTWSVVARAFDDRQPVRPRSSWPRVAAIAVAVAAIAAATLSSPGRAVLDEVREVVGVERAQPALFSLPTPGRLLVSSDAGVWVVQQDGSKRLLGPYREASWSPFGRFVIVARQFELTAMDPEGGVRWTLARRDVRFPRWTGSETNTRVAYVDQTGIRVVGGDGLGDRLLVPRARGPLAWRPGANFQLAYVDRRGRVALIDSETGRVRWRTRPDGRVLGLECSSNGSRLVARRAGGLDDLSIYTPRGALYTVFRTPRGRVTAAATRPESNARAVAVAVNGQARLFMPDVLRDALSGPGVLSRLAWSPDGAWLLASWPSADQWVFVRADGKRIRAVSNVSEQFRSASFPRIEGWIGND